MPNWNKHYIDRLIYFGTALKFDANALKMWREVTKGDGLPLRGTLGNMD